MNLKTLRRLTGDIVRPAIPFLLPAPTKFAIIARGRTGSNLLLSLLTSPGIRMCGEVIGESVLRHADRKEAILALGGPARYVQRCFRRERWESAVGIKILYHQFDDCYGQKWGVDDLPSVLELLTSNKHIRIIHMKRRNRLNTLTSIRVAVITEQWSLRDEAKRVDDVRIKVTAEECEEEFHRIERWERQYDEIFHSHNMIEVYFEDLVSRMDLECNRILDFLGVQRRSLSTPMLRQRTRPVSDIIENYGELKAHFARTEWARFFNE